MCAGGVANAEGLKAEGEPLRLAGRVGRHEALRGIQKFLLQALNLGAQLLCCLAPAAGGLLLYASQHESHAVRSM
jgi:hypothetical protein